MAAAQPALVLRRQRLRIYWPAFIPAFLVTQTVHLPAGTEQVIPHTPGVAGGGGGGGGEGRAGGAG